MVQPASDTCFALSALICFQTFQRHICEFKNRSFFTRHLWKQAPVFAMSLQQAHQHKSDFLSCCKSVQFLGFHVVESWRMQSLGWLYPNQMLHCATAASPLFPPEPLRRWETEQHCVGTAQLYGRRKPQRRGVQSISLARHRCNSRSRDVYGDLCLYVAADRDLCWHNEPPGDH